MPTIPALPTRLARIGLGNTLDIVGVALVVAGFVTLAGQLITTVVEFDASFGLDWLDFATWGWDRRELMLLVVIGLLSLLLGQATTRSGRSVPSALIRVAHWLALLIFGFALLTAGYQIARTPVIESSVSAFVFDAAGQAALAAAGGLLAVVMLARPVQTPHDRRPPSAEQQEQ